MPKPDNTRHIVVSLPHSGTRTLQTYLSESRPQIVPDGRTEVAHWHYTLHPLYIIEYLNIGKGMAYIPVRNPLDVCDSWERRYGNAVDKTAKDMSEGIQLMVDCVDRHPDNIEVFKMEDLPVLRGRGPNPEGWEKSAKTDRAKWLRDWIHRTPEVAAFYDSYYNAEELWWLR